MIDHRLHYTSNNNNKTASSCSLGCHAVAAAQGSWSFSFPSSSAPSSSFSYSFAGHTLVRRQRVQRTFFKITLSCFGDYHAYLMVISQVAEARWLASVVQATLMHRALSCSSGVFHCMSQARNGRRAILKSLTDRLDNSNVGKLFDGTVNASKGLIPATRSFCAVQFFHHRSIDMTHTSDRHCSAFTYRSPRQFDPPLVKRQ